MKRIKRMGIFAVIVIVVLLLGLWAAIATRPQTFTIERSATIAAAPERIFPLINDFHAWEQWSPWDKLDPNLRRTYSTPASGVGAAYAWVGNRNVGEGRMTIVESDPNERVLIRLDFIRPLAATNDTVFTLTPNEGGTYVSWRMQGKNTLVGKIMSFFMDMDKIIGKNFEDGLAGMAVAAGDNPAALP
jgi:uncharacterized protein YndB with AHSA1/START domain